jgi:hypothetical protein
MNGVSNSCPQGPAPAGYCGHCGELRAGGGLRAGGELPASNDHRRCQELLALEPPRYCAQCRRRMKVQVTPLGWAARCSRHEVLVSALSLRNSGSLLVPEVSNSAD